MFTLGLVHLAAMFAGRSRKGVCADLLVGRVGVEISMRKPKSLTRSRTQAGSAVLEGALVLLPMMAIFFAMIDVPFAIFKQNTLRESVREGVRFAITQQTGAGGQDAAIKTVVKNYSMGFLNDADISAGKSTFTITYYDGASLNAVNGVGSNAQGNICVMTASVQHYWIAPVWQSTGVLVFNASSSDVMEAPAERHPARKMTLKAKALQSSGDNMRRRRKKVQQCGSTLLEFAIVVPCLVTLFFGTVGLGIMMGRYIQVEQMARDIAHMYSDGVDFTQTTPQNIVVQQLGAGTGMTTTGGDGVVILSQVQTVYASDCTAAGVSPCTNQGLPVFTQRIVVGNSSLKNSVFGTPSAAILDANGNIAPSVYLSNSDSSVRTSGFESALDAASISAGGSGAAPAQPAGNTAYVVEVFIQYPDIGFLGWSTAGGAYTRFIFQ